MAAGGAGGAGAGQGPPRRGRRGQEPPEPLGSLSHHEGEHPAGTATCESCGSDQLTRLHLALADGTAVTFVSCHRCEHRAWVDAAGTSVGRDEVVARSARPPRP